ncbi:hypothetical protein CHUAL_002086 [Chamberlinius hualienensis]
MTRVSNQSIMSRLHLDIKQWLNSLDLSQYSHCFESNGGVEDLLCLDEADIKSLGVKNGAHRAQIVSSLVMLRSKYDKMSNEFQKNRQRLSGESVIGFTTLVKQSQQQSLSTLNRFIHNSPDNSRYPTKKICEMEPVCDPNANPYELKRALEWELSLDSRDLRSHAWYHGSIPRIRAEELVIHDGDFLIRDCISQPGDYVLTCRWKGPVLHFVINKIVIQPDTVYERVQYQLEDDSYETVPDLVTCYVGSGKPVSIASGVKMCRPINRTMPLSFYAVHYCRSESDFGSRNGSPLPSLFGSSKPSPISTPRDTSPVNSPPGHRRQLSLQFAPPLPDKRMLPSYKGYTTIKPNLMGDYTQMNGGHDIMSTSHQPLHIITGDCDQRHLIRTGSEPILSPISIQGAVTPNITGAAKWIIAQQQQQQLAEILPDAPPPKPSRNPYTKRPGSGCSEGEHQEYRNASILGYNESDSGNGSGDSVASVDLTAVGGCMTLGSMRKRHSNTTSRLTRPHSADCKIGSNSHERSKIAATSVEGGNSEADSAIIDEESLRKVTIPEEDPPSSFNLEGNPNIAFLLPGTENRPLDPIALNKVQAVLLECGTRVLAAHLTLIDMELLKLRGEIDLGLRVKSGLEMITLLHGKQLRRDIIERTMCLKLFVCATILTCPNEMERAQLLRKWIELAIDTKTSLGNLYSFTSIMLGLGHTQIQRLKSTWHALRQFDTDTAFTYETKLRPTLRAMNECCNPQAPNTTIPHLLPLAMAIDRGSDEDLFTDLLDSAQKINPIHTIPKWNFPWEQSSSDYGTELLFSHLASGREYINQTNVYKRNGEIALEHVAKYEDLLLAMFSTEFHLKFLWGSKGAQVNSTDRHAKFEQVLTVLSQRCESST